MSNTIKESKTKKKYTNQYANKKSTDIVTMMQKPLIEVSGVE